MLLLRFGSLLLLALAVIGAGLVVSSVVLPPAPRFGAKGRARKRALEARGLFAVAEPLVRFLAALVGLLPLAARRARQELELRRAGHFLGLSADEYSALSVLSALLMGVFGFGATKFLKVDWALALPAACLGYILPSLQIQEIVRQRAKEISRGLPHAIEIVAMCMGAGLDFPRAIRLVAGPSSREQGALSQELSAILEELELGHTRKEALLSFAERVPAPAVRDFVNSVIQAEEKGNPIAHVIQIQGRMLNMRRSVRAEEAAARAGVLMILPMILLVGSVLLLLMGPLLAGGAGF